jgi:hypothetical protein
LTLKYKAKEAFVDIGAERLIGAERGTERIAVEIKGFTGPSEVTELHRATGQYILYERILRQIDPERTVVLAVPDDVLRSVFLKDLGELLVQDGVLRVFGYDSENEEVTRWLP